MKAFYLKNFRKGLATNSSSTHSVIYRNKGELFNDLNIFELDYYDRFDRTIAASKSAKIKYILADIYWDEELVRVMSDRYPEMKKYYPLIKDSLEKDDDGQYRNEDKFGMYCRGSMTISNNLPFNVDYLTNIIEDENIIIVGGSDEEDFVYDTIAGHVECPDPDSDYDAKYKGCGVVKNGNYWLGFGATHDHFHVERKDDDDDYYYDGPTTAVKNSFQGRVRFATSKDDPIPEYPELIDLRITNQCNHGCKFCFMDSNMKEKEADFETIENILSTLKGRRIEFSIGGGNILLYSKLEELFIRLREDGHIINVTINVKDCKTILDDEKLLVMFRRYVDGIGISIFEPKDVDVVKHFNSVLMDESGKGNHGRRWEYSKYLTMHMIPEYLGVEKTKEILESAKNAWFPILFLGYKTNGRGASQEYHTFTPEELTDICLEQRNLSCDTTFANRYADWLKDNYSCSETITWNEGEYSMYIDAVTGFAYKSSYQLDNPYPITYKAVNKMGQPSEEYKRWYNIKDAFSEIRRDNGFPVWEEVKPHYYDNAKHYWEE